MSTVNTWGSRWLHASFLPIPTRGMSLVQSLNTGVHHLALELIQAIVLFAVTSMRNGVAIYNRRSLSSVRLVCKQFKSAADPILFSELDFDFHDVRLVTVVHYLQVLAETSHPACQYAKVLQIKIIPSKLQMPVFSSVKDYDLLGDSLSLAIESLRNIRIVHWTVSGFDLLYSVVMRIFELPHLEELYLKFSEDLAHEWQQPDMIPLRRFQELRTIDIDGRNLSSDCFENFLIQLREILKNGSSLHRLGLSPPASHRILDARYVLHEIVRDMPRGHPLRLQHFRLDGYSFKFDAFIVPHLRHLISLDISRANSMQTAGEKCLWEGFTAAAIHLKVLVVREVTSSLLKYLRNYTGLQKFTVLGAQLDTPLNMANDSIAAKDISRELYNVILPSHRESLVSFMALNVLESRTPSCITYDDMVSLSVCIKLREIALTLQTSEIEIANGSHPDVKNIVKVALMLPEIVFIKLAYSRSKLHPLNRPGYNKRYASHIGRKARDILHSIQICPGPLVWRNDYYCEVIFEYTRYVSYITDNGFIKLQ